LILKESLPVTLQSLKNHWFRISRCFLLWGWDNFSTKTARWGFLEKVGTSEEYGMLCGLVWIQSGDQTWLAGKSAKLHGGFSITMFDDRVAYRIIGWFPHSEEKHGIGGFCSPPLAFPGWHQLQPRWFHDKQTERLTDRLTKTH
jgi:hypothetical protein